MKTLKTIGLLTLVTLSTAFAGDKGGNGGSIYACNDKAYLIDLEEVSLIPGLKDSMSIKRSEEPVYNQAKAALERLKSIDYEIYQTASKRFEEFYREFPKFFRFNAWKIPNDLGLVPEKEDCEFRNVINYLNDYNVQVNQDLFDTLSKTDQAALMVHEVLYGMARNKKRSKQDDSLSSRRIVAYLFSDLDRPQLITGIVKTYLSLRTENNHVINLPSASATSVTITHSLNGYGGDNFGSWAIVDGVRLDAQASINQTITCDKVISVEINDAFVGFVGTKVRFEALTSVSFDGEEKEFQSKVNLVTGKNSRATQKTISFTLIPGFVTDYIFGRL